MQGLCNAPAAALASLIWVPGVLNDLAARTAVGVTPFADVNPLSRLDLTLDLELPPPRG